ncbi:zinc-ribbon domain-containing protein [Candidatus Woesearchaeota archaeon]|jgi:hypothetical protein|nr:zinc-ribbon domain-containing protein [Candidatus Woesearchaeota archaeon]
MPTQKEDPKECPFCGIDVSDVDAYCAECGTDLKESDEYNY